MRNKNAVVSDPNTFVSNSGDRYHIVYSPHVNVDGTIELVESGKDDIQEYINSFRDQTDMAYILQRLQVGDTSVLHNGVPFYGDVTQFPKTYAETLQVMIDARQQFDRMPLEVRNKFDNDFNQWFAQAGSEDWYDKMESLIPKADPEVVSDRPIENEVKE